MTNMVHDLIVDIQNVYFGYNYDNGANIDRIKDNASDKDAILKNFSLQLYHGESAAIVGGSGSGKSTIMHLIYGHLKLYSGSIRIFGHDISQSKCKMHEIYRNIGFITQFDTLLYNFSIIENVAMPLIIQGCDRDKTNALAVDMLHSVGLSDDLHKNIAQLSGGQKKRVMIARALIHNPKLILADEATGDLDQDNSDCILDMILHMVRSQKISVLWITHDKRRLQDFDKIVEL